MRLPDTSFRLMDMDSIFNSGMMPSWPILDRELEHGYRFNEKDNYFHLSFDIPGIEPKNLSIQHINDHIVISSKSKDSSSVRKFSFSFLPPRSADVKKMKANLKNGVLDVVLPKLRSQTQGSEMSIETQEPDHFLTQFTKKV